MARSRACRDVVDAVACRLVIFACSRATGPTHPRRHMHGRRLMLTVLSLTDPYWWAPHVVQAHRVKCGRLRELTAHQPGSAPAPRRWRTSTDVARSKRPRSRKTFDERREWSCKLCSRATFWCDRQSCGSEVWRSVSLPTTADEAIECADWSS